jgi:hypothetical protein
MTEERNRLSFESADWHTLQSQATTGIPCEVPVPRKVRTTKIIDWMN